MHIVFIYFFSHDHDWEWEEQGSDWVLQKETQTPLVELGPILAPLHHYVKMRVSGTLPLTIKLNFSLKSEGTAG